MILFFGSLSQFVYALQVHQEPDEINFKKLEWLFNKKRINRVEIEGSFIGPRATMITPWSTNAVEITQNMAIEGIKRIEIFTKHSKEQPFDHMLLQRYEGLDQDIFTIRVEPQSILQIEDIAAYNQSEGLALNREEIEYLNQLSETLDRPLTDSEVFGFSQVNSEHCRHKIFNGTFIIDGEKQNDSLFQLIKKTSKANPNSIVSAYEDNVAFTEGPEIEQFAPQMPDLPSPYEIKKIKSVISLKAETHNFPTTVEPFNGAATGSGGEIRDRLAGGMGSLPLAGTAVYMTPYSRVKPNSPWEKAFPARLWRYQSPLEILIKASNGTSDFGNKFGQPLISGSLFTFEHQENGKQWGYDKVIMMAGGVGGGHADQAQKQTPKKGDLIVILGGDNYRIGMGGATVSSASNGTLDDTVKLNAIQRSNPEMQKRVANVIRGLVESANNPIVSIHDHGAGGHLNCLSELVENNGGSIFIDKLPLGDPTLSAKEIIGNESQERMGLVIHPQNEALLRNIAKRERTPMYVVGTVGDDRQLTFIDHRNDSNPIDLHLDALFGNPPKTIITDTRKYYSFEEPSYTVNHLNKYLEQVLQIEAVACKDWLTNKVDRCVTGRVAQQQTVGELQLPLSNCGVVALDYSGKNGVATSIGHAPLSALIDPAKGSVNAISESLTNIVWAPLEKGLESISLSANWMWACKSPGEDARLYEAVKSCSDFAIDLGINIPTGKDSLSMKQQYDNGAVIAPGTVIISAVGQCSDINKVITPDVKLNGGDLYYINISQQKYALGGSAFAQILSKIGNKPPCIDDAKYFKRVFNEIQKLILQNEISAGHDISSGGLITTLLEMCFPSIDVSMQLNLTVLGEQDSIALLFAENSGIVLQSPTNLSTLLAENGIICHRIGSVVRSKNLEIKNGKQNFKFTVDTLRDFWVSTSAALDAHQTKNGLARERFKNYKHQPLRFKFPDLFTGKLPDLNRKKKIRAAVIREQGSNSEREIAYAMHLVGFEVIDVHMTDLISGREDMEEVQFLVAAGGFSNSDVLGSAKGWAGSFLYNKKAKTSLERFFKRDNTLSLGVCNGCQLFIELGLITPNHEQKPKMLHNRSEKFECHFTAVTIQPSSAVMMKGMEGSTLGIWAAHGEGRFHLPLDEARYQIPAKYHFSEYPANPNGSDYNAAMLASEDGRNLVMMPHLERSTFQWNWAHYPPKRKDQVSPWIMAFENAYNWLSEKK